MTAGTFRIVNGKEVSSRNGTLCCGQSLDVPISDIFNMMEMRYGEGGRERERERESEREREREREKGTNVNKQAYYKIYISYEHPLWSCF